MENYYRIVVNADLISKWGGTVFLENNDGDNVNVAKLASVPAKSSLELMTGNKYVMEASDILKVKSDIANSADVTLSIMEIS